MKKLFPLALALAGVLAPSSPGWQSSPVPEVNSFRPDHMSTILYGAAYYPEYSAPDRIDRDIELMERAGINLVRVGESTWSSWEPREGQFEYQWMSRVLDRLHRAGIRVIIGTPTYSIPTWLYKQHPEIAVTHLGTAPPLSNPHAPAYPPVMTPGFYGPRQNYDFLNPYFRQHAEWIIRHIVSQFRGHPAVAGFQVDNETFPNGVSTPYTRAAFLQRLKRKYETTDVLNRVWGLAYWGQLVDTWNDLPDRGGILNPGYKLEWENFQHDIVTDYLAWQTEIVNEYKRSDQFVTTDFSGGVHTNLNQWAIAEHMDIAAENVYFETQGRLTARDIWMTDDLGRSLKQSNFLIAETNAETIGWDSRTQYPPFPGQLRLTAYAHLAAGANMVEYWHWGSLHNGQETYWKGLLAHDGEPNRVYDEASRTAHELKRLGPELVNLRKANQVAILVSTDSANALSYMPFNDHTDYMTILRQMYGALYDLNIEPDFVRAGSADLSGYKVLLVPPLYSASDEVLYRLASYIHGGGHVVMSFKSGFTDEHSTVRGAMAPGPLRAAAGFHYQEFTNLAGPERLTPDAYNVGNENVGSVWKEFLALDTAHAVASFTDPVWHFPAITKNSYGKGTLTYEATVLGDTLQREVIRHVLRGAKLTGPDQELPAPVKVRHGRNTRGRSLHYYFNFSDRPLTFVYGFGAGKELLTSRDVLPGQLVTIGAWDLAIAGER